MHIRTRGKQYPDNFGKSGFNCPPQGFVLPSVRISTLRGQSSDDFGIDPTAGPEQYAVSPPFFNIFIRILDPLRVVRQSDRADPRAIRNKGQYVFPRKIDTTGYTASNRSEEHTSELQSRL